MLAGKLALQFGHDVGVVETEKIIRGGLLEHKLQFGHDVGVVETSIVRSDDVEDEDASIRPRRWSRGDYAALRVR